MDTSRPLQVIEQSDADMQALARTGPGREIAPAQGNVVTPMEMLDRAFASGAAPETLEKLMTLHERWEAREAKKAFVAAIAKAKGEIKPIMKNRTVDFASKNDSSKRTNYRHEDMAGIAEHVDPILSKYGLSYRFRTRQPNGMVEVTCILAHEDGHEEENTLSAGRDESGNKNNHQAIGSSTTYLERYTLKAALGLSSAHDDDAQATGAVSNDQWTPPEPSHDPCITDKQADIIRDLIKKSGAPIDGVLKYAKAPSISDIKARHFAKVHDALNNKLSENSKGTS